MKRLLLPILLLVTGSTVNADLLDRIRLEDAVRIRIEDVVKVYDPRARVLVRFDYKSFSGELPGTSFGHSTFSPARIESGDITKVSIDVFSEKADVLPAEAKDFILRLVPADRSRVDIQLKKFQSPTKETSPVEIQNLTPDALSKIAHDTTQLFLLVLGGLLVVLFGAFAFFNAAVSRRRTNEIREQLALMAKSIGDMQLGGGTAAPIAAPVTAENRGPTSLSLSTEVSSVEKMPVASLRELFADCYWCERDGSAAWLWKKVPAETRAELMKSAPFMKDYCASFLTAEPEETAHHEHPFYLDPTPLSAVSQEDLADAVRAQPSLWHRLSPLRQQNLPLSLEEKLKAMQSVPAKAAPPSKASAPRALQPKPAWGQLTVDDETAVFRNPDLIPAPLRPHVKSLVWLARKDQPSIQRALSKYDARALAAAWVGPDEVLKKLESALPEKKLKLLETYRERTPAARNSPVFLGLVDEGLKDDAA